MAYFGQKDARTIILTRMVRDLDVPVECAWCRRLREPDGAGDEFAHRYLDPDQRQRGRSVASGWRTRNGELTPASRDLGRAGAALLAELQQTPGAPGRLCRSRRRR